MKQLLMPQVTRLESHWRGFAHICMRRVVWGRGGGSCGHGLISTSRRLGWTRWNKHASAKGAKVGALGFSYL